MSATCANPQAGTNDSGRDSKGRFAAGNSGGPGNPFGRYVSELRRMLMVRIDAEKIAVLFDKMYELAMDGNVQAAKLIFSYILGKPPTGGDSDRVNIDEWKVMKEEAKILGEMPEVVNKPGPELPLTMARAARPGVTEGVRRMYLAVDGAKPQAGGGSAKPQAGDPPAAAGGLLADMLEGAAKPQAGDPPAAAGGLLGLEDKLRQFWSEVDKSPSPNGKSAGVERQVRGGDGGVKTG